ncbi:MAG: helix-turn-helix domain-containing protein, partial [Candidatus Shapirobacteria bacterium]
MRQKIEHTLRLAGLREEEVTMYLHLLILKRASMAELIAETGLNVMTAYRTMKRLQERGLVQSFDINQKQSVYAPLSLGALIQTLGAEE